MVFFLFSQKYEFRCTKVFFHFCLKEGTCYCRCKWLLMHCFKDQKNFGKKLLELFFFFQNCLSSVAPPRLPCSLAVLGPSIKNEIFRRNTHGSLE